ncbi:aspartate aminotransferase family protein [Ferruginivarius sediminum]|uniref:Aspartate aminotransferase family protein n=1 Tax=Ferruginivarius sediminum TaxID=2661937 RepID=A0A369TCB4_9PROT|nr:aspartate aminotransferase family protein [Ferruginivarius sediminum]RDD61807.1 aspartate aminotransferase family protein [Ferruginivarius sediminum]
MTDATHNLSLEEMDRQSVIHPFTHLKDYASGALGDPRIVETGKGVRITDQKGKTFIDGFAGLYCVNAGYGRTEIADAIYEQAKKLAYYHAYAAHSSEPVIRLSDRILRKAPANMRRVYYGSSGSDANETQAKIVWYYNNVRGKPEKKKIISRHRGYHGGSMAAGSMTGLPVYHKAFDLPIDRIKHTTAPHYYWGAQAGESEREFSKRCAGDLESMILAEGPETVAAFIGEPVLGTGGIIPPPEGYWQEIQAVLDKYDVLLIDDEVVTGFGRIGTEFGSDYYGMKPDLMTVAKGLTSAYLPLSGVIVGDKVWKVLEQGSDEYGPFAHGYTYSAHTLCAAAGLANLDIIDTEDLTGNARDTGSYLQDRLQETFADHPIVGEVRGVGLLAALEFVADKDEKTRFDATAKVGPKVAAACLERGLIVRAMPHGDILGFAPPLVISRAEVDEVVDIAKQAVDAVTDQLSRDGILKAA